MPRNFEAFVLLHTLTLSIGLRRRDLFINRRYTFLVMVPRVILNASHSAVFLDFMPIYFRGWYFLVIPFYLSSNIK